MFNQHYINSFLNLQAKRFTKHFLFVENHGQKVHNPTHPLKTKHEFIWQELIPMVSEMVLASEGFSTDVTGEGSLVCVCPLVDQEVVGLGEMATTEFTDVLLLLPRERRTQSSEYIKKRLVHEKLSLAQIIYKVASVLFLGHCFLLFVSPSSSL